MAKNYNLKAVTRWIYTNHPDWCDDDEYSVLNVRVERITTLNGEVLSVKTIENQDHVLRISSPESMAAAACLRMNSIYMDEEVYVGF